MIEGRCKRRVVVPGMAFNDRQCSRKIWKDGYCSQHHPDTVKKRREEGERRYKEKWAKEPFTVAIKNNSDLRKTIHLLLDFIPEGWEMPLGWQILANEARQKAGPK
jgi:hypothetical protein